MEDVMELLLRDLITGELEAYVAKGTCIATGGYGRVFKQTTNAVICEGTGAAIALETGIATLGNMEAVQVPSNTNCSIRYFINRRL